MHDTYDNFDMPV